MTEDLEERLRRAALETGMTAEEAERATADALSRIAWRLRRGSKECGSCHEEKPVVEFTRNSSRRDGLHHSCRSCERKRDSARRKPV